MLQEVPAFFIKLIEDIALSSGLSVDELHQSVLDENTSTVSAKELEAAVGWLIKGTQKPWLALELGKRTNIQQFDVFGPLIASCETVKEGLELFSQYQTLLHPLFGLVFDVFDDVLCLRYSVDESMPSNPIYAEAILGALPVWYERLTGKGLSVHRIWFRHSKPSYCEKYTECFQCEIVYDQAFDGMWIDSSLLDEPILSSAPTYHSKVKKQATAQLKSMATIATEIKRIIRVSLPEDIGADEVASVLFCSERTMQRKLAEEGVQFKTLKQMVRKEEAIRLLEETSFSIEQIAFQVGYEQRNSFAAAFQRWTGVSPAKWRR